MIAKFVHSLRGRQSEHPVSVVDQVNPGEADWTPAVDLGNLSAATPKIKTIEVEVCSPCAVRSTVPWMYVEPSALESPGRQTLQVMLDTDSLVAGTLIEAEIRLEMSTGNRVIRVYGSVDESWSEIARTSVVLQREPWCLIKKLQGHQDRVRCLAFVAQAGCLVSGSDDCTVRWWDIDAGCLMGQTEEYTSEVWSIGASRDGRYLAIGLRNGCIILEDVSSRARLWLHQVHRGYISGLVFSKDGQVLISSSGDHSIGFTDVATGQPTAPPLEQRGVATSLALSGNGLL